MSATVEFYFDFVSPYSYIAFKLLQRLKEPWQLELDYKPMRLARVLKESANNSPASVPAKMAFLSKDIQRTSAFYGIPFHPDEGFLKTDMRNSNYIIVVAQEQLGREWTEKIIDAIWEELFVKGQLGCFTDNITDLSPILCRVLSPHQVNLLVDKVSSSDEIPQRFMANTSKAIAAGVFGAPTMLITKDGRTEFFFGSDRFHHIARFLGADPSLPYTLPKANLQHTK